MRRRQKLALTPLLLTLTKLFLLLGLIASAILIYRRLFLINYVLCTQTPASPCPPAIIAELNHLLGRSLLTLDSTATAAKIKGANPWITDIAFVPQLPGTVTTTIRQAQPLAQVAASSSSASLIIATNHYLSQPEVASSNPPVKIIYQAAGDYQPGQQATDSLLLKCLDLLQLIASYYLDVTTITLERPDYTLVSLTSGTQAIFDLSGDLTRQVIALELIITGTSAELPQGTIDLRLEKPIILSPSGD